MSQIPKFARVEERAATDCAMLKPDVVLVESHHANHQTAAARAKNAIHGVKRLSQLGVAGVNGLRPAHFL
jgi:hypothetical protein